MYFIEYVEILKGILKKNKCNLVRDHRLHGTCYNNIRRKIVKDQMA